MWVSAASLEAGGTCTATSPNPSHYNTTTLSYMYATMLLIIPPLLLFSIFDVTTEFLVASRTFSIPLRTRCDH